MDSRRFKDAHLLKKNSDSQRQTQYLTETPRKYWSSKNGDANFNQAPAQCPTSRQAHYVAGFEVMAFVLIGFGWYQAM